LQILYFGKMIISNLAGIINLHSSEKFVCNCADITYGSLKKVQPTDHGYNVTGTLKGCPIRKTGKYLSAVLHSDLKLSTGLALAAETACTRVAMAPTNAAINPAIINR
jgi:hypothetical protein